MMYKRGLSDIVTTLLIILLAFASVAIIWVVVKAFIFESAGQLEIGQVTNRFSIPDDSVMVNNQLGLVIFNVKREAGDGDIVEINVILKDKDGTSKNFPQDFRTTSFNVYESKRVEVTYLGSIAQLASISLSATIKNQDGKELKGSPVLAYTVKGSEKLAGMVLWLDFENGIVDKSGWGNVVNVKGDAKTGADNTATNTNDVNRGSIAFFDGAGDYIEIINKEVLNFGTGSFSIAFWAKPDASQSLITRIMDKSVNANPIGYYSLFTPSTSYTSIGLVVGDGTNNAQPQYSTLYNQWRLYVFVVDKDSTTKKVNAYIYEQQGKTSPTLTGTESLSSIGSTSNLVNLVIGANSAGSSNYYKGKLDDIMLFNRKLSEQEIQQIYTITKK